MTNSHDINRQMEAAVLHIMPERGFSDCKLPNQARISFL